MSDMKKEWIPLNKLGVCSRCLHSADLYKNMKDGKEWCGFCIDGVVRVWEEV